MMSVTVVFPSVAAPPRRQGTGLPQGLRVDFFYRIRCAEQAPADFRRPRRARDPGSGHPE
ncbi:hypothetical protein GCM10027570_24450 [Streptomonospora sediminis]